MLDVQLKQTEPATVAFLHMSGGYDQIPDGYRQLYEWVGNHGLQPVGMPEAVYFTNPEEVPPDKAEWELWAPVAPVAEQPEPAADRMGVKSVGRLTVAAATHKGTYDSIESTYRALGQWIAENGYMIVGPSHEVYFSDPEKVPPEETLTEIRFPVERRG